MKTTVKTRFAPSPTGDLHLGSVRTALYSWLYARHHGGVFVLRIEDTDLERSTAASTQVILEGMEWLRLAYDEGPFFQSRRTERYQEVITQLLQEDKAYYCACSKERLEALREEQMRHKQKPRYDGHCRDLRLQADPGRPMVVRFKNPVDGEVTFEDQVYGTIRFQNQELDDLIIARSDGSPTYNFTVVVDDFDMEITHVIRGDDHINNTPRQIQIFKALGAEPPVYAHLPMLLGSDGKRLSKRHGAVSVLEYRNAGYLPEALLNYLVRLGWAHGDQEIFSVDEMIRFFDFDAVHKSPAAFDMEKLAWLNQHYLKTLPQSAVAHAWEDYLHHHRLPVPTEPVLSDVVEVQAERCKTLAEMTDKSHYFFHPVVFDEKAVQKHLTSEVMPALEAVMERLQSLDVWDKTGIHQVIVETAESRGLGLGKLAQPIRVAVTGVTASPPLDATLFLLGKEKTIYRLGQALKLIATIPG